MADLDTLEIKLDLVMPVRRALIEAFADLILDQGELTFAIILEILSREDISATMIATEFGERVVALMDEHDEETSWHEVMADTLEELRQTPGGAGEVLHDCE